MHATDPTQTGILQKVTPENGNLSFYDPATNTFGVYTADGDTVTFYKPGPFGAGNVHQTPMDWWNNVPGVPPEDLP